MDIQGIREGALFAMHNMQDVWSFLIYRVFLLAGMTACYIYRQQEGRHQSRPKAEGIIDMDKEIRYFVNGYEMLLYLSGDREERKSVDCFELQDFESEEEAVAAAREFIKEHKNAVNDQKHGIGSVTYWTAEVTRCIEDEDFGWLPCDADGATEDGHGLVPADATAEYICTLDGSREERAFQRAKYSYYDFLDYKDDCYTTVSGYMD